jgi:quercetin dioxygenase-like cupin family protein
MRGVLEDAARQFIAGEHLKNVLAGEWVALHDEQGDVLAGIRGRIGAAALSMSGCEIGVDLIEMQPGAEFPLHVHAGDHILYVLSGPGVVHIDGADRRVETGDTIFIAAEHPHGVKTLVDSPPLRFLAFGHPHKHVSASDRMELVSEGRNHG